MAHEEGMAFIIFYQDSYISSSDLKVFLLFIASYANFTNQIPFQRPVKTQISKGQKKKFNHRYFSFL
jgi:hypothetical protein